MRQILHPAAWVAFNLMLFATLSEGAPPQVAIEGPSEKNPGSLIVLSATGDSADSYAWILTNSDETILPVEGGTKLVAAIGTDGVYTFILAGSHSTPDVAGSSISIARHVITIGTPVPAPDPDKPLPQPDPQPDPDKPIPRPTLTGHAAVSFDSVELLDATLEEIDAVSQNMKSISSQAAGLGWSVGELQEKYAASNTTGVLSTPEARERWRPYFGTFQKALSQTTGIDGAIQAFSELADGLDAYTKWKRQSVPRQPSASTASEPGGLFEAVDTVKKNVNELRETLDSIKTDLGQ